MTSEKNIREHFGWSQESLALYLDVSVSLIKMVEAGKRSLPTAAEIKLVQLQLYMLGKDATGNALPKADKTALPAKADGKKLLRQANRYELLTEKTKQQLTDMQQRYQQAQNSMALFDYLQPTVFAAADEAGKKDQIWLELIEAKAVVQLRRNGPEAQALLQWRIDCYGFAVERARELAGKSSPEK